jgi:Reverse transcriptase (RNA-dependent DNA polymerase)
VKTVEGLVQSCRMTMGLNNASAYFQRLVNNVYDGVKGKSLQANLDDLAVGSETARLHVKDVWDMLERTRRANLRLKFEKCTFGKREVELLGHKVVHPVLSYWKFAR